MAIENIDTKITASQFNFSTIHNATNNNGIISKISNYLSDFEIMEFDENIASKIDLLEITGAKVSAEITSKLSGIESWFYDANKFVEKEIIPVLENVGKNITNALERTTATIALGGLSLIEGLGQFGEAAIDLVTISITAAATVRTGIFDGIQAIYGSITGKEWESVTKKMWNKTKGFVAEKYVTKAFDDLYNNTGFGNYIKENAFGYETVRTIGSGLGYVAGIVAISLLTFGAGGVAIGGAGTASGIAVTAGQTATVAGLAGIGKGTQDSWSDGAGLGEGLATGTLNGLWEGLQFYLGAKIGGSNLINLEGAKGKILNSLTRIALDGLDGGAEGFIQPLISAIYKDGYTNDQGEYIEFTSSDNFFERYGEIFNDYGSWKNVLTQASVGTIGSIFGETLDLTKLLKTSDKILDLNSNSININQTYDNETVTRDLMFAIGAYLEKYGGDPERVIAHLKNGILEQDYSKFTNHNGARNYIKEYDFETLLKAMDGIEKAYQSKAITSDMFSDYSHWEKEMLSTNFDSIFDKVNSSAKINDINSQIDIINRHAANGRFYTLDVESLSDIPPDFWSKIDDPSNLFIRVGDKTLSFAEAKPINFSKIPNESLELKSQIDIINRHTANGRFYMLDIDSLEDVTPDFLLQLNDPSNVYLRVNGCTVKCSDFQTQLTFNEADITALMADANLNDYYQRFSIEELRTWSYNIFGGIFSQSQIDNVISKMNIIDELEWPELLKKRGYNPTITGFVDHNSILYVPSNSNMHTVQHEMFHKFSEIINNHNKYIINGKEFKVSGIREFYSNETNSNLTNETLTEYLTSKYSDGKIYNTMYDKGAIKFWERIDNAYSMSLKEQNNHMLFYSYLRNDTSQIRNFFEQYGSKNITYDDFVVKMEDSIIQSKEIDNIITEIEKNVSKQSKNILSILKSIIGRKK